VIVRYAGHNSAIIIATVDGIEFTISLKDIYEIDRSNNILKRYLLNTSADYTVLSEIQDNSNVTYINISFALDNARLLVRVILYEKTTTIDFAGKEIIVPNGGVKYYARVENWPFEKYGNKLAITLLTSSSNTSAEIQSSQNNGGNLDWMTLYAGSLSLYSQFLSYALLDDLNTTVQFVAQSQTGGTSEVQILIPHFWDYAEIDPNYAVLVEADQTGSGGQNQFMYIIIAIVVACVVAVAIIIVVTGLVIKKRRRTRSKSELNSKLSSANLQEETFTRPMNVTIREERGIPLQPMRY